MLSGTFHCSLGANACVELHLYEEAIAWCDKGLAVSFYKMYYSFYHPLISSGLLKLVNTAVRIISSSLYRLSAVDILFHSFTWHCILFIVGWQLKIFSITFSEFSNLFIVNNIMLHNLTLRSLVRITTLCWI